MERGLWSASINLPTLTRLFTPLMKRILLSPMPWAVFVLAVILTGSYFSTQKENTANQFRVWSLQQSSDDQADYALLRPFISQAGTYSIALEGGREPIFAIEVPSVTFGPASECPLQLLLLCDWDSPATRHLYQEMEKMYRDDHSSSLPPLKLSLLPSRSGSSSGHFMEWIIATHFVASHVATLPTFLSETSGGSIQADKGKIRARLEEIEPEIVLRAEVFMSNQKPTIEKSYRIAQAQLRLNEKALQCSETTQLVSMKQILTGSPGAEQIKAFLLHAKAQQDAFLSSPTGLIPLEPKRPR